MPKYLFEVDYTKEGSAGLQKTGGSQRRETVARAVESVGGRLEAFYFTFGLRDAVVIAELPDQTAAVALSLAVSATGSVAYKTTVLISPEEVDKAAHQSVSYTPPGD